MELALRRGLIGLAAVSLIATGCADDEQATVDAGLDAEATDGETATAEPVPDATKTVTETVTVPASPTATAEPGQVAGDPTMDFIFTPEPPYRLKTGSDAEFLVGVTAEEGEFPAEVHAGFVPCEQAHFSTEVVFVDDDGDGTVGHWGETSHGHATLEEVNGEPVTLEDQPAPVETTAADVSFLFTSSAPDCLIPIVFEDTNGDGALNLDEADVPTEPFGASKAIWEG